MRAAPTRAGHAAKPAWSFHRFAVGTVFVVTDAASARILGAVHAAGGDRIYCTRSRPTHGHSAGEPEYELRGVVEPPRAARRVVGDPRRRRPISTPAAFPQFATRVYRTSRDVLATLNPRVADRQQDRRRSRSDFRRTAHEWRTLRALLRSQLRSRPDLRTLARDYHQRPGAGDRAASATITRAGSSSR